MNRIALLIEQLHDRGYIDAALHDQCSAEEIAEARLRAEQESR